MNKLSVAIAVLLFSIAGTLAAKATNGSDDPKINWLTFEEAVALAEQEPKKIIIDVFTDWCGWCKVMDKKTFTNEAIIDHINKNYYAVKLDAEQKEDITFRGTTFSFVESGRNGYHELAASLLQGQLSFPSLVFLDEELNLIQPIPGYQKPEQLHPILDFFVTGYEKDQPWDEFIAEYQSPFAK